VDTNRQIGEGSREAEELLGYSALEAVGKSIEIIIPQHLRERDRAGFARHADRTSALPEITTTIAVHKTGRRTKLPISVNAICGKDEEIAAVEATFYSSRDLAWQVRGLRGLGGKPNVPFLLELCASSLDPQMSPLSGFRRKRNKVV
jgi:PAS domain S-box-containing protein